MLSNPLVGTGGSLTQLHKRSYFMSSLVGASTETGDCSQVPRPSQPLTLQQDRKWVLGKDWWQCCITVKVIVGWALYWSCVTDDVIYQPPAQWPKKGRWVLSVCCCMGHGILYLLL